MTPPEKNGAISKETMLMIAAATFVIGFLSGIVFSVYKSGPTTNTQQANGSSPMIQAPAGNEIDAKTAAAILSLEREVATNKDNLQAWVELGHRYFDTNQPAKAIPAYNNALRLDPANADIWTDLGVMYRRNGQPTEALNAFNMARDLNPTHQQSRFNRGVVYLYDLKDTAKAISAWKEVLAINPLAAAPNGQPLSELIADVEKKSK